MADFQDELQNKADDFGGKAKETLGDATNNESLKNEGKADQATAGLQDKVNDAVDAVKDGANELLGKFKNN